MDNREQQILEILNAMFIQEFQPYVGSMDVEKVDHCDDRYYTTHTDSNIICLFPPIDHLLI
jgi:hypothetical protein